MSFAWKVVVVVSSVVGASWVGGCAAPRLGPLGVVTVQVPAASSGEPPEDEDRGRLRVLMSDPGGVSVDGQAVLLGAARAAAERVLGPPDWARDYPRGDDAMSETVYLFYIQHGVAVRTKEGIVQGVYVYLRGAEIEERRLRPAEVVLPEGIPRGASIDAIVGALGEPAVHDRVEIMHWHDLLYLRGRTVTTFHFEETRWNSISVELAAINHHLPAALGGAG
jgi:hypothetical protein